MCTELNNIMDDDWCPIAITLSHCLKYIVICDEYLNVHIPRPRHVSDGEEGRFVEEDIILQETAEGKGGVDVWWDLCSEYHASHIRITSTFIVILFL